MSGNDTSRKRAWIESECFQITNFTFFNNIRTHCTCIQLMHTHLNEVKSLQLSSPNGDSCGFCCCCCEGVPEVVGKAWGWMTGRVVPEEGGGRRPPLAVSPAGGDTPKHTCTYAML